MTVCTYCHSALCYTTYIRTVRRNAKSHRSKQAYLPAGTLCLDCLQVETTLDAALTKQIRKRRSKPSPPLPDTRDQ